MNIDLRTMIAIRRRVEDQPVLLYHDVKTPKARAARIERIRRWLGHVGLAVTDHYLGPKWKRTPLPPAGQRKWQRAGGLGLIKQLEKVDENHIQVAR